MMKNFLLSIGLIFIASLAFGQNDKVFFKNGSKLRGTVVKNYAADTIAIVVNMAGEEIVVPLALVEEIRFKKREFGRIQKYRDYVYQQGYFKTVKVGAMFGSHSGNEPLKPWLLLEGIFEYHHHPLLNGGIGAGLNIYDRYVIVPVYAQYQVVLSRKTRSLYLYGRAGHGFVHANVVNEELKDVDSGRLLSGGVGFQKKTGEGFIRYQVGYLSQRLNEIAAPNTWIWGRPIGSEDYVVRKRVMNRLVFSVSYSF